MMPSPEVGELQKDIILSSFESFLPTLRKFERLMKIDTAFINILTTYDTVWNGGLLLKMLWIIKCYKIP